MPTEFEERKCSAESDMKSEWDDRAEAEIVNFNLGIEAAAECIEKNGRADLAYFIRRLRKAPAKTGDCPTSDCNGNMRPIHGAVCSCHISPPCTSCVEGKRECSECGHVTEYSE